MIAGGGIGGLAAAIALTRAGWQVEVLEQATRFGQAGAGLTLWPNALRALDHIGLGDQVRAAGRMEANGGVRGAHGRWLMRAGLSTLVLHRKTLLKILEEAVPKGVLRTNTRVIRASIDKGVVVEHTHGESRADLLVGADGINSVVRNQFWPRSEPVYSGSTAWRMTLRGQVDEGVEFWGRGEEFGVVQLPDDQVYMFAGAVTPAGRSSSDGELAELLRRFGNWPEPVSELLPQVRPDNVMRHDIYYVPRLPTYVRGPVVLIGDAAHAMTPNLGQGGCQALEDAVTLPTLDRYDRLRRRRSQRIARMSFLANRVILTRSRLAIALRDNGMRIAPAAATIRMLFG